ncbi:MAG: hypothetical protein ACXW14_11025, partial [Burkholderiaceae bacterium]
MFSLQARGHGASNMVYLTMLAIESQQVICLRTIKIAAGGKKAHREARPMVSEKVAAGLYEG